MSNSSSTAKNASEVRQQVERTAVTYDLGRQIGHRVRNRLPELVHDEVVSLLNGTEGHEDLEPVEVEFILSSAAKHVSNREVAEETLFAYHQPRWYLNLLATGLAVVGIQTAFAYGKEWLESLGEGEETSPATARRTNPFADPTAASGNRPARLRRDAAPGASVEALG